MVTDVDRKSTRLNSSHLVISYAVFCLKKKKKNKTAWGLAEDSDSADEPRWFSFGFVIAVRGPTVSLLASFICFFNDTATTEIYTLSLHDALPIYLIKVPIPAKSTVCGLVASLFVTVT